MGAVPVTLTGLSDYRRPVLEWQSADGWRKLDQSIHGNDFWQCVFQPEGQTWEITFTLRPHDAYQNVGELIGRPMRRNYRFRLDAGRPGLPWRRVSAMIGEPFSMASAQLDFFHLTDTTALSPRLAVVIPCYNHAAYVEAAIRSVLKQTRPVDRLIVIDDGSTDNSVEVIRAMGEPLVELHVQENQNAYNTINRGVAMAATDCDFIAILNSDDHYHPERFEKLLPVLLADAAAEVVCSGLRIYR